jgi:hypothetical protein
MKFRALNKKISNAQQNNGGFMMREEAKEEDFDPVFDKPSIE